MDSWRTSLTKCVDDAKIVPAVQKGFYYIWLQETVCTRIITGQPVVTAVWDKKQMSNENVGIAATKTDESKYADSSLCDDRSGIFGRQLTEMKSKIQGWRVTMEDSGTKSTTD
jgi:hypothetical protein